VTKSFGRRSFLVGASFSIVGACTKSGPAAQSQTDAQFAQIEAHLGGRLGVAALDTGNGARLSYRGGERFAMCSTFKWMLAAAVLARVERGEITLNQPIPYSAADMLEFSPVSQAHLTEGRMGVEDMCAAIVEVSDNTAANLLLALIGGPAGLTTYLRELGDPVTRLDRNEPGLNTNLPDDPRDTTTPDAMVGTMTKILLGDALSPNGRERLTGWMKNSRTGLDRLRAGLPRDWITGDKTGGGANGATNDNAIVWPPDRAPILIAAYLSGSRGPLEARNAAHAEIGSVIVGAFN
jgi:beta-lactamase class A